MGLRKLEVIFRFMYCIDIRLYARVVTPGDDYLYNVEHWNGRASWAILNLRLAFIVRRARRRDPCC